MSNDQTAPETRGVAVEALATVDLAPRSTAWRGAGFGWA